MRGIRLILVFVGALSLSAFAAQGCAASGNDCAEKATCGDDGSAGDGTVGPADGNGRTDGQADGTLGTDGEAGDSEGDDSAGETGADANGGDAGTDATPDVASDARADAGSDSSTPDTGPTCAAGSTCVDKPPTGWVGPLALSQQTSGSLPPSPPPTAPACPSSYPSDVYDGNSNLYALQAVCGCTCGSVNLTGAKCGPEQVTVYGDSLCGSACTSAINVPASGGNDCVNLACDTGQGVIVTPATATGGSCSATPSVSLPAAGWTSTARACLTSSMGTGCAGSSVCVPIPPSPYSVSVCVSKAGDVPCPGGSYTQKNVFYGGLTADTRGCTTCACTPSGLTCSGAKVTVYGPGSAACDPTNSQQLTVDGICNPITISPLYYAAETKAPTLGGGSCSWTSGGQPDGGISPMTPTTICCQP